MMTLKAFKCLNGLQDNDWIVLAVLDIMIFLTNIMNRKFCFTSTEMHHKLRVLAICCKTPRITDVCGLSFFFFLLFVI